MKNDFSSLKHLKSTCIVTHYYMVKYFNAIFLIRQGKIWSLKTGHLMYMFTIFLKYTTRIMSTNNSMHVNGRREIEWIIKHCITMTKKKKAQHVIHKNSICQMCWRWRWHNLNSWDKNPEFYGTKISLVMMKTFLKGWQKIEEFSKRRYWNFDQCNLN